MKFYIAIFIHHVRGNATWCLVKGFCGTVRTIHGRCTWHGHFNKIVLTDHKGNIFQDGDFSITVVEQEMLFCCGKYDVIQNCFLFLVVASVTAGCSNWLCPVWENCNWVCTTGYLSGVWHCARSMTTFFA